MTQRVLLIGVDEAFIGTLSDRLCRLHLEIARARQEIDAVAQLENSSTDAILMDADPPHASGIELCKRLRQQHPSCPILVCTTHTLSLDAVLFYEAGADDYFEKSLEWVVIEAKIRRALRRCSSCRCLSLAPSDDPLRTAPSNLDRVPRIDHRSLTRIEERLLDVLAAFPGRVVSKSVLVSQIWGRPRPQAKSLYEHVSTLRAKLLPTGWTIANVRGSGYRLQSNALPSQSRPNELPGA